MDPETKIEPTKLPRFRKIKSFTLVELVIALLVSGIVVSLAGSTYLLIKKMILTSSLDYEFDDRVMDLAMVLKHDFDRAAVISKEAYSLSLQFPSHEIINYQFGDSFVMRQAGEVTDSFHIKPAIVQMETLSRESEWVTKLYLLFQHKEIDYPVHLKKDYTRDLLFQLDHNLR